MIEVGKRVKCTAHQGTHRGVIVHHLSAEFYAVCWDRQVALRSLNEQAWNASREALNREDGFCLTKVDAVVETEWQEDENPVDTWPNRVPV